LVIDNKLVAAAKEFCSCSWWRTATIQELITTTNLDPRRGYGHENVLTQIDVDRDTEDLLEKLGYTLATILKLMNCILKSTANLSTGAHL
jgi:cyanophycin synthetase